VAPTSGGAATVDPLVLKRGLPVEPVGIPVTPPMEFDGMTRAQIFALREAAVAVHSDWWEPPYRARPDLFQIVDGKPWWGMVGQFVHRAGPQSIDGPSEESRFVLNPYLLVGLELDSLTNWGDVTWRRDLTPAQYTAPGFPLACTARDLSWSPGKAEATAVYDVGAHVDALAPFVEVPVSRTNNWFSLDAINARDLGFNFAWIDLDASQDIFQSAQCRAKEPFRLMEYIHLGGSCGYPGGCNNGSPYVQAQYCLRFKALPALLVVKLWRAAPASSADAADFTFRVELR
jgi:hypothetical protein